MRIRILVLDDEEAICEILKYNLEKDGYDVDCAYSAEDALAHDLSGYSLFVVDIMMGKLSGFDFVKRVKNVASTENIPIIFCSALYGEDDKVMGLNIGADDYISKPFMVGEVLARVRAVLRRSHISHQVAYNLARGDYEPDISYRQLRISRNEKLCYVNGVDACLTRTEYDLLLFFMIHRNRIHRREDIVKNVWDNEIDVSSRAIDTNITRLRKKIGEYGNCIVTRVGYGYGFTESN